MLTNTHTNDILCVWEICDNRDGTSKRPFFTDRQHLHRCLCASSTHTIAPLLTFADDTTIVRLISKGMSLHTEIRWLVGAGTITWSLINWSMHQTTVQQWGPWRKCVRFPFLGIQIEEDLSWTANTLQAMRAVTLRGVANAEASVIFMACAYLRTANVWPCV